MDTLKPLKQTKREIMLSNILEHGKKLNAIFGTDHDPMHLCKKLHRLEKKANRIATDWCNGVIGGGDDESEVDNAINPILKQVKALLGDKYTILFNGDCRGYALKIDSLVVKANNLNIYQDWGGNGIIAPDFSN